MNKIIYVNPDLQEMLDSVPKEIAREVDLSFDIAKRIYDILNRKGWSQADFARAAGKKEAEISKWMSGQHNFTIRTVAFIETVLGEKILAVRQYRTTKSEAQGAIENKSVYTSRRNYSPYASGLLNDEGEAKYSSRKKGKTGGK